MTTMDERAMAEAHTGALDNGVTVATGPTNELLLRVEALPMMGGVLRAGLRAMKIADAVLAADIDPDDMPDYLDVVITVTTRKIA